MQNMTSKMSNKLDYEQQIQKLKNEQMKLFEEYQKETKEIYNKKYRQKRDEIKNAINQLQNKKEAEETN